MKVDGLRIEGAFIAAQIVDARRRQRPATGATRQQAVQRAGQFTCRGVGLPEQGVIRFAFEIKPPPILRKAQRKAACRLSGLFTRGKRSQSGPYSEVTVPLPLPFTNTRIVEEIPTIVQIKHTWTISPSLLNQASIGFNRLFVPIQNATVDGKWGDKVGIKGLPAGEARDAFLEATFAGPNAPAGFSATGTLLTATGNAYASYLLGLVNSATVNDDSVTTISARYRNWAWWAQDDYKLTPRLTLNLGLRYDIMSPFREVANRMSFLNPTAPNAAADGRPGVLNYAGDYAPSAISCNCSTPVNTFYGALGPRLGLAYSLNDKMVIRAAYGLQRHQRHRRHTHLWRAGWPAAALSKLEPFHSTFTDKGTGRDRRLRRQQRQVSGGRSTTPSARASTM